MIARLKQLWERAAAGPERGEGHDLSLAVAALMVEVMRMDGKREQAERDEIARLLGQRFRLDAGEIDALIKQAGEQAEQALDLHQFTVVVVKGYSSAERCEILTDLWRVVMADGHIDAYEEQLLRRVAELLGIHHREFIASKLSAGTGIDEG